MNSLSVVIPLYNKEHNLRETVQSVLSQTYKDFKLIVVNDGSSDNSLGVLSEFKDSRILIFDQENRGVSAARNKGINESKTEYIALLDADDVWDSGYLADMMGFIQDYPEAALFGCGYSFQNINSKVVNTDLGLPVDHRGYIDYFYYAKDNTLFTSSSVIFRKDAFLEIGGFDETLSRGEDIDLWIRFALTRKVAFYNRPLVIYKLNAENRAFNNPVTKKQCLIWNLNRYSQFEKSSEEFKEFLDNWRLAHVHNYLTGTSNEVTEIGSILNSINLKNKSLVWTILKHLPKVLQPYFYTWWGSLKNALKVYR